MSLLKISHYIGYFKSHFFIHHKVLILFISGLFSGLTIAILMPVFGKIYFHFYTSEVSQFIRLYGDGNIMLLIALISLRNSISISPLIFFPYILVKYRKRLGFQIEREGLCSLDKCLKLLSFCPIFTYGLAVFGLFIGHLLNTLSFSDVFRYILSSMVHGWIEIIIMLSAASTGVKMSDILDTRKFYPEINLKNVLVRWFFLIAGLAVAAIIETSISPLIFEFLKNI